MYPVLIFKCLKCGSKFEEAEFCKGSKYKPKYCTRCSQVMKHKIIDRRVEDGSPPLESRKELPDCPKLEDEPTLEDIKEELRGLNERQNSYDLDRAFHDYVETQVPDDNTSEDIDDATREMMIADGNTYLRKAMNKLCEHDKWRLTIDSGYSGDGVPRAFVYVESPYFNTRGGFAEGAIIHWEIATELMRIITALEDEGF